MSDLSRIDERLSQVVELLRCLLAEIRKTRQALEQADSETCTAQSAVATEEQGNK